MAKYNDGFECRIYKPVQGQTVLLGATENTSMEHLALATIIEHNPSPVKKHNEVSEADLDHVLGIGPMKVRGLGGSSTPFSKALNATKALMTRRIQ